MEHTNNTVILGAGGLGRELYSWISGSLEESHLFNVLGFLDDSNEALNGYDVGLDILGNLDAVFFKQYNKFLVAIANCKQKELLFASLSDFENEFLNYIHSSVILGSRIQLGTGTFLSPNVIVSCDVKIGDLVFVNCGSQIGHDVTIGDFCSLMATVNIGGGAIIGKRVLIGTGAIILPGVNIPDDTIIGAGSVVIRSIKTSGTYFGNPAKKIF